MTAWQIIGGITAGALGCILVLLVRWIFRQADEVLDTTAYPESDEPKEEMKK